jgi:hypothetical protein
VVDLVFLDRKRALSLIRGDETIKNGRLPTKNKTKKAGSVIAKLIHRPLACIDQEQTACATARYTHKQQH